MTADYRVEILAPCDWINSNHRTHRMVEARRVSAWRAAAKAAVEESPVTFGEPVHITATIHKTRAGRWDAGNLYPTAKALVDGIVDAGVIRDDSNEYVIGPDMRAGEKRDTASVVIEIKAIR